jgi:pimeloyl-ACP methyl ester carboxylesterase
MLIHADRLQDKDLTDTITAMAERLGREAFHNQQTAIINRIDSRPYLKDIRCPVQVIGGMEDQVTPPEILREIADGIPHARFDIIENCGHLSPLEQPDKVNALMRRWLAM